MPLVSICIPTYSAKRLHYLREAVASALRQTHADLEVIISDNGNDEEIRDFAERQVSDDPRVRYRRNDTPFELGGSFNAALNAAGGQYVVLIGDDDRLLPGFCETLLLRCQADTAVAFSNHYVINAEGRRDDALTRHFTERFGRANLSPGTVADPVACVWRNSVPLSAALIRTTDAKRLGIKVDLRTPEFEFFARLASECKSFIFEPECLVEYRVHPNSETAAGLAGERLIPYLEHIEVPPHAAPLKRRFMRSLLESAVSNAIVSGNQPYARELMRNLFYPTIRERPLHVLFHSMLCHLPDDLAQSSFARGTKLRKAIARATRRASR